MATLRERAQEAVDQVRAEREAERQMRDERAGRKLYKLMRKHLGVTLDEVPKCARIKHEDIYFEAQCQTDGKWRLYGGRDVLTMRQIKNTADLGFALRL